jgi:hypothetical protein
MDSTTFTALAQLTATPEPFAFLLDDLLPFLARVLDPRARRGRRYPPAPFLALAVVAKLADHADLTALANWARLRQAELCSWLGRLIALTRGHWSIEEGCSNGGM